MSYPFRKVLLGTLMAGALSLGANAFAAQAPAPAATKAPKTAKMAAAGPTDQEIADAKAKGEVWVNTSTKAYHKSDDKYYGKTKHGKFMSEEDAQKAGYHVSGSHAAKKPSAAKK
jgi:uncharacterized membrane protein YkoI